MVLDAGRIIEFDPPGDLLSNKNTVFYSMAEDAGLISGLELLHIHMAMCDEYTCS